VMGTGATRNRGATCGVAGATAGGSVTTGVWGRATDPGRWLNRMAPMTSPPIVHAA